MDQDGLVIPLFQSLTQPILMAGVPRALFIVNMLLGLVLSIPLQLFYIGVPMCVLVHTIAAWFTRNDPHYFDVLMRHMRQAHYWN